MQGKEQTTMTDKEFSKLSVADVKAIISERDALLVTACELTKKVQRLDNLNTIVDPSLFSSPEGKPVDHKDIYSIAVLGTLLKIREDEYWKVCDKCNDTTIEQDDNLHAKQDAITDACVILTKELVTRGVLDAPTTNEHCEFDMWANETRLSDTYQIVSL